MNQGYLKYKSVYLPGTLTWLKQKVYTEEEVQDIFDNIDLDKV